MEDDHTRRYLEQGHETQSRVRRLLFDFLDASKAEKTEKDLRVGQDSHAILFDALQICAECRFSECPKLLNHPLSRSLVTFGLIPLSFRLPKTRIGSTTSHFLRVCDVRNLCLKCPESKTAISFCRVLAETSVEASEKGEKEEKHEEDTEEGQRSWSDTWIHLPRLFSPVSSSSLPSSSFFSPSPPRNSSAAKSARPDLSEVAEEESPRSLIQEKTLRSFLRIEKEELEELFRKGNTSVEKSVALAPLSSPSKAVPLPFPGKPNKSHSNKFWRKKKKEKERGKEKNESKEKKRCESTKDEAEKDAEQKQMRMGETHNESLGKTEKPRSFLFVVEYVLVHLETASRWLQTQRTQRRAKLQMGILKQCLQQNSDFFGEVQKLHKSYKKHSDNLVVQDLATAQSRSLSQNRILLVQNLRYDQKLSRWEHDSRRDAWWFAEFPEVSKAKAPKRENRKHQRERETEMKEGSNKSEKEKETQGGRGDREEKEETGEKEMKERKERKERKVRKEGKEGKEEKEEKEERGGRQNSKHEFSDNKLREMWATLGSEPFPQPTSALDFPLPKRKITMCGTHALNLFPHSWCTLSAVPLGQSLTSTNFQSLLKTGVAHQAETTGEVVSPSFKGERPDLYIQKHERNLLLPLPLLFWCLREEERHRQRRFRQTVSFTVVILTVVGIGMLWHLF